jgi:hypothetical protein
MASEDEGPTGPADIEATPIVEPEAAPVAEAEAAPLAPYEEAPSTDKVILTEYGATAKVRNPWLVLLFTLITLGIYYLFWYYFINREMSDYGQAHNTDIGMSPGMSVVAITIGSIIIVPPFVSLFRTGKRMRLSRSVAGISGGSGGLFFVLSIIPFVSLFAPVYMQSELNGVWRTLPPAQD